MVKASPGIFAFNAGEWSEDMEGRTDLAGYSASLYRGENIIPLIQGPATKRPGFRHVQMAKDRFADAALIPFIVSRSVAYVVEFGNFYCRFFFNRAPVLTGSASALTSISRANPAVVSAAGHGFSNGDQVFITGVTGMSEVNDRWFTVANAAANSFTLANLYGDGVDTSGYGADGAGGTADRPLEIASPYATADIFDSTGELLLDFTQSNDVMYIADRTGVRQQRRLVRSGSNSFAFELVGPSDGPYLDINAEATTIYLDAATGATQAHASAAVFDAAQLNGLLRVDQEVVTATQPWEPSTAYTAGDFVRSEGHEYEAANSDTSGTTIPSHTVGTVSDGGVNWIYRSSGYGVVRITNVVSPTVADVTVVRRFPQTLVGSGNASTLWRLGAWTQQNGFPESVSFFRARLTWGQRNRLHFSVAENFDSYAPDNDGLVTAENAITKTIASDDANDIVGMAASNQLLVFADGAEVAVGPSNTSEAFGPNNIGEFEQTGYGSRAVRPIRVGEAVLFLGSSGTKLREAVFDVAVDGLVARDLNVRAAHISVTGFNGMARQKDPFELIWLRNRPGELSSLTYDRTQEVRAWTRHPLGGENPRVRSLCAVPNPNGARDDLYILVNRVVDGRASRSIEFLAPEDADFKDQADAFYVDAGLVYDGAAATTLYGLDHLEGETVRILADGERQADQTVAGGAITLDKAASTVSVGLSYKLRIATQDLDYGAREGSALGKKRRNIDIAMKVKRARGGGIGVAEGELSPIEELNNRDPNTPMDQPAPLISGLITQRLEPGYDDVSRIWIEQDDPYPFTLIALYPQTKTQEAR